MKLIHLADLHIGKAVDRMKMLEDQKYILARILDIIEDELPDAVLISGDVYDRGVPPSEAVTILDEFVCRLSRITLPGGEFTRAPCVRQFAYVRRRRVHLPRL